MLRWCNKQIVGETNYQWIKCFNKQKYQNKMNNKV